MRGGNIQTSTYSYQPLSQFSASRSTRLVGLQDLRGLEIQLSWQIEFVYSPAVFLPGKQKVIGVPPTQTRFRQGKFPPVIHSFNPGCRWLAVQIICYSLSIFILDDEAFSVAEEDH